MMSYQMGMLLDQLDNGSAYLVHWPTPRHCLLIGVGKIDFLDSAISGKNEFYCKRWIVEPEEFRAVVNNFDEFADRKLLDCFTTIKPVKRGFEPWEMDAEV